MRKLLDDLCLDLLKRIMAFLIMLHSPKTMFREWFAQTLLNPAHCLNASLHSVDVGLDLCPVLVEDWKGIRHTAASSHAWKHGPRLLQLNNPSEICSFPVDEKIAREKQEIEAGCFQKTQK